MNDKINGKKMFMAGLLFLLLVTSVWVRLNNISSGDDGGNDDERGDIEFPILIDEAIFWINKSGLEIVDFGWQFQLHDVEYNGTWISTYDGAVWCLIIKSSNSATIALDTYVGTDPTAPITRVEKNGIDVTENFSQEQDSSNKPKFFLMRFNLEPGETWNISGVIPNGTYKPPDPWWEDLFKRLTGQDDGILIDGLRVMNVGFEDKSRLEANFTKQATIKLEAYLLKEGIQPYEKASGLEILATFPAVAFLALIVVKRRTRPAQDVVEKR